MTQTFNGRTIEGDKGFWTIFPGLCKGCGLCIQKCPKKCMSWSDVLGVYGTPSVEINSEECIACGTCQTFCPDTAIAVERKKKEKKQ
ncbi:2-oxoglutarate oxidoreductase delta subunit [Desulfocucumis palustris]|uniref:2-oxoglutarate oxidoreductase delta subunit n=1 Tax=Desulfocucumis palustris TaxID=1898651 RepID=A0A2L2XDS7_9FIRM|nr:4Fe-4S binding protein [Desulfocucumis palustris]GBF34375.1 2-oxoglutarate oxidoreductase delta subunit [Desulfocucumis palustris]